MNDFFRDKQGNPLYLVGLQAHNSSTGTDMLDKAIRAVQLYGGNVLETPIYWNAIEPEMGKYDMSLVQDTIDRARAAGLYLILLWFATSKNGHPNYAPEYIKLDPATYRIAHGADGAPLPALSPHCEATLERDALAFETVMAFLKAYDGDVGTVLAVQIENEMGLGGTDPRLLRDRLRGLRKAPARGAARRGAGGLRRARRQPDLARPLRPPRARGLLRLVPRALHRPHRRARARGLRRRKAPHKRHGRRGFLRRGRPLLQQRRRRRPHDPDLEEGRPGAGPALPGHLQPGAERLRPHLLALQPGGQRALHPRVLAHGRIQRRTCCARPWTTAPSACAALARRARWTTPAP